MSPFATLSPFACLAERADADLLTSLEALRAGILEYELAPGMRVARELEDVRRAVAKEFADRCPNDTDAPAIGLALENVQQLIRTGALDLPLSPDDERLLQSWEPLGPPGVIASMMMTVAWRWKAAPLISAIPEWLRAEYAEWLLVAPDQFRSRQERAAFASHVARHLDETTRWAQGRTLTHGIPAATDESP